MYTVRASTGEAELPEGVIWPSTPGGLVSPSCHNKVIALDAAAGLVSPF